MRVISNTHSNHGEEFSGLLNSEVTDLFMASPFITSDFSDLFKTYKLAGVKSITLVTTLKENDKDQITKPSALKSFYEMARSKCPNAKVKVHVDNSLHGKIYIFKSVEAAKAIVTSANLTYSGFYSNHEWGLLIDSIKEIAQLENEVLESIDYPDVTEFFVDRLMMYSEQYQKDHPDWGKVVSPESNILEHVYNQEQTYNKAPKYYLKPVGVSEDPIYKEHKRDFSDLHQDLYFSKKGTGAICAGDVVITTAVGCGCLLSCFEITGRPQEATANEKLLDPWKERWPFHIQGRNKSQKYGGSWWEYDLDRKVLLEEFLRQYPNEKITKAGGVTFGTLNFGSDKVEITEAFGKFLIERINQIDSV